MGYLSLILQERGRLSIATVRVVVVATLTTLASTIRVGSRVTVRRENLEAIEALSLLSRALRNKRLKKDRT